MHTQTNKALVPKSLDFTTQYTLQKIRTKMKNIVIPLLLVAPFTQASVPTTYEELNLLNRHYDDISYDLVGIEGFTENVDLYSGALSLGHRDLVIPGNGGLDIEINRYYNQPSRAFNSSSEQNRGKGLMGYGWQVHMGYVGGTSGGQFTKPSTTTKPTPPVGSEFTQCWSKNTTAYNLPLTSITTFNGKKEEFYPASGGDYMITKSGWRGGCNKSGYIFYSPEGLKHTYNIIKYQSNNSAPNNGYKNYQWYVSKIEDKHGNWLQVHYESTDQMKIDYIASSDGRFVDFQYGSVGNVTKLTKITSAGRVIDYKYDGNGNLKSVDIGQEQRWAYSYSDMSGVMGWDVGFKLLESVTTEAGGKYSYTYYEGIPDGTGPATPPKVKTREISGNLPSSTIKYNHGGTSSVYSDFESSATYKAVTNDYIASITKDGYGTIYPQTGSTQFFEDKCISTKFYDVSQGNWLAGQLAYRTTYANSDCTNEVETQEFHYDYIKISDQKTRRDFYEYYVGFSGFVEDEAVWKAALRDKTITRDGNTYVLENTAFTPNGAPTTIVDHSSINTKRTVTNSYVYPSFKYGIELLQSQTLAADDDTVINQLNYEFNTDYTIKKITQNGVSNNYEYHADGSLKKIIFNGSNRYDLLEDYYRGIPRKVTQPCPVANSCSTLNGSTNNTVISKKEVNADGTLKSYTSFRGIKNSYDYDGVGRIKLVDPADTTLANTSIIYSKTTTLGDGITGSNVPVGSLKQTISKGNYRKIVYYDGLIRPILTVEKDASITGSEIYSYIEYDKNEKLAFEAYPSSTSAQNSNGIRTTYDALNRVLTKTRTADNSTILSNEYLADYQLAVTDGENNTITTTYLEYSAPTYSLPTLIDAPDSADTVITYNEVNNITSITQGSITESRYYDSNQNLCKVNRPETGKAAFGYNARNMLSWFAEGTNGSATACDAGNVPASHKTIISYDNLNMKRSENFPDTTPDRTFSYDEDGNLTKLVAGDVVHSYLYNSLGLPEHETLTVAGKRIAPSATDYSLDYDYNSLGHLAHLTYPDGDKISFSPNVFGQPTKVSRNASEERDAYNYLTNAKYHATGQIHTFNYGNGLKHETLLNNVNLPRSVKDYKTGTTALSYSYTYDDNANVKSITDNLNANYSINNLIYDGVNRLKQTVAPQGGFLASTINYDLLGNIESYTSYQRNLDHAYDSNNRLKSVAGVSGKYGTIGYDSRGNITSNGKDNFTYNRGNQMVTAKSGANQYLYDGHNKRVRQIDSAGTSYSLYSLDGTLLYRETDLGGTNYLYLGKKLIAKDGFIKESAGKQHYRPFGESIEGEIDDVGYTGHKFDQDLGLSYMQARYYDPVIGRFYSNDPQDTLAQMNKGNITHSFNRYSYVNNNPYRYTDPNGEWAVCATPWTFLACVGAGAASYGIYSFVDDVGELGEAKLNELEAQAENQESYMECIRSNGSNCDISSSQRELSKLRKQTLNRAAEAAESGCIVGTSCGGPLPTSTNDNGANGFWSLITGFFGGDEGSEDETDEKVTEE